MLSHVQLFATPWTATCQASLSMGFPRQEYWSGLPFPSLGDLPDPGNEPASPALAGGFFTTEPQGKLYFFSLITCKKICIDFNLFTHLPSFCLVERRHLLDL